MSLPATISLAVLDTILGHLVPLLLIGAGGDQDVARAAVCQMLAAFGVENEHELSLAAEIIGLRLHGLAALGESADPELSLNKKMRLRGSAVSLSREAHKSQRKLDQLQRDRRADVPTQSVAAQAGASAHAPESGLDRRRMDQVAEVTEVVRQAVEAVGQTRGMSWSKALQKRQTAKRIVEKLEKNRVQHLDRVAKLNSAAAAAGAVADQVAV